MPKTKYTEELLTNFAKDNNVILIGEYKNPNSKTPIKGYCITPSCAETFEKPFNYLLSIGPKCKECSKKQGIEKNMKLNKENHIKTRVNIPSENKIGLKNKDGDIVDYAIVSPQHFDHLIEYAWSFSHDYVATTISGKPVSLHAYVITVLGKQEVPIGMVIDHKNRNKLDNRIENLQIVSQSHNSRNKTKKENATSQYFGVSKRKYGKSQTRITLPLEFRGTKSTLTAHYDDELHAAYQYDLWVDKYGLPKETKNNVEKPENFVEWESVNQDLPISITIKDDKYLVNLQHEKKFYFKKSFDDLDDAIEYLEESKEEMEELKMKELYETPILKEFNEELGVEVCYFIIKNKIGEEYKVLIDEDIYYDIIKHNWNIKKYDEGYRAVQNKEFGILSRFILNYKGPSVIDHINSDPLDNRKENLRIVTKQQNGLNRSKGKNESSSKYMNISDTKLGQKRYLAQIIYDGKRVLSKTFKTEIEAVIARDIFVLSNSYLSYMKLNLPRSDYVMKDGKFVYRGTKLDETSKEEKVDKPTLKVHCDVCKFDMAKSSYSRHLKTDRHIKNLNPSTDSNKK